MSLFSNPLHQQQQRNSNPIHHEYDEDGIIRVSSSSSKNSGGGLVRKLSLPPVLRKLSSDVDSSSHCNSNSHTNTNGNGNGNGNNASDLQGKGSNHGKGKSKHGSSKKGLASSSDHSAGSSSGKKSRSFRRSKSSKSKEPQPEDDDENENKRHAGQQRGSVGSSTRHRLRKLEAVVKATKDGSSNNNSEAELYDDYDNIEEEEIVYSMEQLGREHADAKSGGSAAFVQSATFTVETANTAVSSSTLQSMPSPPSSPTTTATSASTAASVSVSTHRASRAMTSPAKASATAKRQQQGATLPTIPSIQPALHDRNDAIAQATTRQPKPSAANRPTPPISSLQTTEASVAPEAGGTSSRQQQQQQRSGQQSSERQQRQRSSQQRPRKSNGGSGANKNSLVPQRRKVKFRAVQIRTYAYELGDNPAVSVGAPLTISWQYDELPMVSVTDYEAIRTPHRRTKILELLLNYYQREAVLVRSGYTPTEVARVTRDINRIRRQRQRTAWNGPLSYYFEYTIECAKRKVRKQCCGGGAVESSVVMMPPANNSATTATSANPSQ